MSRNRLRLHTAAIRARETTSRDISLNTSSSREIFGDERNSSINRPYYPFNRRRRVFHHSIPSSPQTMTRNTTILSPLNTQGRPRNNINLRNEIDNTPALSPLSPPPLPRSPGGTLVPPPIRIPPPPPLTESITIPRAPSTSNEMTRLIDSPTNAQNNDTIETITPNTRNRSNSMIERGMRRRSPRRHRSRRVTVPFQLPNLVQTTETDLINTPYDSPVRIRPSIRQIRNATEVIVYSQLSQDTRDTQSRCPIDIVEFSPEDTVLRIRHCGHIFREMNLRQHFRRNPRCPLCRFDIRDYVASSSATPASIRNARAVLARVNETLQTNLNSTQNDSSANTITSLSLSRRRTERTNTRGE